MVISERCGVFADPSILAAALAEFADTEQMLAKCEAKFGTYGWGRYDLLVLPPAFPFGGMENPTWAVIIPDSQAEPTMERWNKLAGLLC